jgi:phage baseplate assembly protein W
MPRSAALDIPFRPDGAGKIMATYDLTREIALRLRSIIGTNPGERVMRPNYGSGAGLAVFEANDNLHAAMLVNAIKTGIQQWEPAVTVDNVSIDQIDLAAGVLKIRVEYHLVTTGEVKVAVISVTPTATAGWPS